MIFLNVFTNENGEHGNPVGIITDIDQKLNTVERQKIATDSGLSEVVFINDIDKGSVSLYNPEQEISFAGHALVGVSYYLNQISKNNITQLSGIIGPINTWSENSQTWVSCQLSSLPNWNIKQLKNKEAVEKIYKQEAVQMKHTIVWSWVDEEKGVVQARTFASDWSTPEDEANGSGSMKLASMLNRELIVIHGKGSVIYARPAENSYAEVGGVCAFV